MVCISPLAPDVHTALIRYDIRESLGGVELSPSCRFKALARKGYREKTEKEPSINRE
jgi:hypothetical protein